MKNEDTARDLSQALGKLEKGGIILYPTDTIWGLGCDATNEDAVKRLFDLKHRPGAKAMISLVGSLDCMKNWVKHVPDAAIEEIKSACRPITVIYDSPFGISDLLKAEDGSAAFRIPDYEFTKELCLRFGKPIVSTSANFSGANAPNSFEDIDENILKKVDYICQNGRNRLGNSPSRIIKISNNGEKIVIRE